MAENIRELTVNSDKYPLPPAHHANDETINSKHDNLFLVPYHRPQRLCVVRFRMRT